MRDRQPRTRIAVLASVVFVDLLGLAIILPSLPFFVLDLGGSGVGLGLVLTGYSLAQVVAAPILGRLSDRHGRRRLLLLSLAGSAASFGLAALAHDTTTLIVSRVLAGLCGGSISVAYAFASDITTRESRTTAMSWIGAGIGLAFTVGPAVGALLAPLGFAAVCWTGAVIAAVNLAAAWRVLPRPGPASPSGRAPAPGPPSTARATSWALVALVVCGGVVTASFVSMETTLGLTVDALYGWGPGEVGWLLAACGLSMVLTQAVLGTRSARRLPDWRVTIAAMALLAVGLTAIPVAVAPSTVLGALLLSGGYGAFVVTQASLISTSGASASVGARLGWSQSANAAGRACGPVVAGLLYDAHAVVPYALASCVTAVAAVVLTTTRLPLHRGASHRGREAERGPARQMSRSTE